MADADGTEALTDREKETLRLLLGGHTAKSAAAELDLSVHTVNDYLREARKKLGVSSSREAARILGEQEETAPQKDATEQIGMADAPFPPEYAKPSATPGSRKIWLWIIGALIMLATAIAAVLALSGTQSSNPSVEDVEASVQESSVAEQAARSWIALVDAGNYTQSWEAAGTAFRTAVTVDQWAAQVDPVRSPLGAVKSRKLVSIEAPGALPGAPEGDYRIAQFATSFAKAPGAVETAILVKEDGAWKVVGYFIR
ncbi:DUF4019 domain-containing protein [Erythrobacter litoralis]|uniref:helix-turn-helix domain-containing protein n=1 Tax=Erythrobacter litoralis TaxID=39960 RepID=UPI002434E32B|nr:DUF4019 domain-containing protein [Erythrobacter litoralis]MDG6078895.1 DUF4019 domain-containing protein [Erythrobacter litoralis]